MARSRVVFHPEATREIEEACAWYGERGPAAEEGFLAELDHAVQQVAAAPLRWPQHRASTRRFVFRRYPYSLIYRPYAGLVRVLAIAHDKRRTDYGSRGRRAARPFSRSKPRRARRRAP